MERSPDSTAPTWLTFGGAADAAGIGHRQLEEWARSGELGGRVAWRGETRVRLLNAVDLARLVPESGMAITRAAGSLVSMQLTPSPTHPKLKRTRGVARMRPRPREAGPEFDAWANELEREIQRLRTENDTLREERDALIAERDTNIASPTGTPSKRLVVSMESPARAKPYRSSIWSAQAVMAAALAVVCGVAIGTGVARYTFDSADPVEAAERSTAAAPDTVTTAAVSPPVVNADDSSEPRDEAAADDAIEDTVVAAPVDEPATSVDEEPEAAMPIAPEETLEAIEDIGAEVTDIALAAYVPELFRTLPSEIEPCAYTKVLADHPDALGVIGPCFGPHGEHGQVGGAHRVSGLPCCRHHAFVERMTSASSGDEVITALMEEAEVARGDGFVPPLIRLRAERSAVKFLRAHAGGWLSAGLDGGVGRNDTAEHGWAELDAGDDEAPRLELRSWIDVVEANETVRRTFVLRLRLESGAEGDVVESFRWTP